MCRFSWHCSRTCLVAGGRNWTYAFVPAMMTGNQCVLYLPTDTVKNLMNVNRTVVCGFLTPES